MPRKRLPPFAKRFTCIARLNPRWNIGEETDRYGLRCNHCMMVFWAYQGDEIMRCTNCGRRVAESFVQIPNRYGYFLVEFDGYTPGGEPAKASQAEGPQA